MPYVVPKIALGLVTHVLPLITTIPPVQAEKMNVQMYMSPKGNGPDLLRLSLSQQIDRLNFDRRFAVEPDRKLGKHAISCDSMCTPLDDRSGRSIISI